MASSSIFMQAMEGIQSGIQGLVLTSLPNNRVVIRRLPHDGEHYFPGITLHPIDEKYHQGTNMRESVGYGVGVTMVVNCDNDKDYQLDRLLLWRESIRRYFVENTTLSTVTAGVVCTIKVEHENVIDWNKLKNDNNDVSMLVVRVYVLETRS